MASSTSSFANFDWSDFKRAIVPYIERSVSGPWFRRYLWCAAMLWVLTALVSVFVTHSSDSLARDWRESYQLETNSNDTRAWQQCGFCVVVDTRKRVLDLEEDIERASSKALERCATSDAENKACEYIPWPVRSLLRDYRNAQHHAAALASSSTTRHPLEMNQVLFDFKDAAQKAKFRPSVERYRSPLGWGDFPAVFGMTSSVVLLFGIIVALPFRVVVLVGRELYQQTWMLLVATQQPVSRILFALVIQAVAPLAMIAAPLFLTATGLLALVGHPLAALSLGLSLLALASVWSAFGVTVPALIGRHVAPAFLTLFSLFVSGVYALVVINVGEFSVNSSGDLWPRLWIHSGLDVWLGVQSGFGVLSEEGQRFWQPNLARSIAQVALIPASLLWIAAHAHRCQPGRVAGLSRRGWFLAWSLAGLVLGARCFAGVRAAMEQLDGYGGWSWHELGAYAVTGLIIPFTIYLTTPAHPLSHRPDARLTFGTWAKRSLDAMLAVGIVWFCQAGAIFLSGACDADDFLSLDGLVAVKAVWLWCFLMTGVSLLLARGLDAQRSKLEFFSAALLGLSLTPAVIFVCTASEHSLRYDSTFTVPSFVGFEFLLYFLAVGIVALGIRRTRPQKKGSK